MSKNGNVVISENPNDEETKMNVKIVSQVNTADGESFSWRKVIIGGVAGVALGAAASYAMAQNLDIEDIIGGSDEPVDPEPTVEPAPTVEPEPADPGYDEMSFGEAFAAARAELGPGEVFEWRGALFSTYYAEEVTEQPIVQDPIVIDDPSDLSVLLDDMTAGGDINIGNVTIINTGGGDYVDINDQSIHLSVGGNVHIGDVMDDPGFDDPNITQDPGTSTILGPEDGLVEELAYDDGADDDAVFDNPDVDFM